MLQRIQSIWLLLAAACAFLSLEFPFFTGNYTDSKNFTTFERLNGMFSIPLILVTVAIGITTLICIFLYKNRKLQFRLTLLCIILEAVLIFLYYSKSKDFANGAYALTALLQACAAFFLFLAARGINHDERIIKQSNRLR